MLDALRFENVGPAKRLALKFKPRMNFLVGDNGLGKSFVLDAAWWALTQTWARPMLRPHRAPALPTITYRYTASEVEHLSRYDRKTELWELEREPPPHTELIIYAQVDGGFSVRDPARNVRNGPPERPAAYLFAPHQLWKGNEWCNGLLHDWAMWQLAGNAYFDSLTKVLHALSPSEHERLVPGKLRRLSVDDPKNYPTLSMPYDEDVIVGHASAGMRRVIALAYLLVWTWHEHLAACELIGSQPTSELVLIVDELESHLHPQWQRRIVPALLDVMDALTDTHQAGVQLIAATHSPLVLASTESQFDTERDVIWAFDLVEGEVELEVSPWRRRGDANNWLSSPLFDLGAPRSLESERALNQAYELVRAYKQAQLPEAEPEWSRRMREDRELRQPALAEKQRERDANNRRVLNENLERIRTGEHRNLLYWLCRVGSDSGSHLTISLDKLRDEFGEAITSAACTGLQLAWRAHRPLFHFELDSRMTITGDARIGLAGLQLAFEAGLDLTQLSDDEVELAARYAVHELNGFPKWFEPLCLAHPGQVAEALKPAIEADLHLTSSSDSPEVLGWVRGLPEALQQPLAAVTLDTLERGAASHPYSLERALEICAWLEAPARVGALCERQTWDVHNTDLATIWWVGWLRSAPGAALDYLEEFAHDAEAADLDEVVEAIAGRLGTFPGGTQDLGALGTDVEALERLILVVYGSIRAEEDIQDDVSGQASVITERRRAESFRHGLGELLANNSNPEAAAALDELAREPLLRSQRWWFVDQARRVRQASARAQPLTKEQTTQWLERLPRRHPAHPVSLPLPMAEPEPEALKLEHCFDIEFKPVGSQPESDWKRIWRKRTSLSWAELLEHRWVVLQPSAEPIDLRHRSARLSREGLTSACIDIPALARGEVEGALPAMLLERLHTWRGQRETEATVFLDWIEEPPSELLPAALRTLRKYVGDAHTRLRLVVNLGLSPRPTDKHALEEFIKISPVESTTSAEVQDLEHSSATPPPIEAIQSSPAPGTEWVLAHPKTFEHAALLEAIEARLGDHAGAFIDALERAGGWELLLTRAALNDALERWREHGSIGTRTQLLERGASSLLGRASGQPVEPDTSSAWAQLCEGLARLCAATVVSGSYSIALPNRHDQVEQVEQVEQVAQLDPRTLLPSWVPAQLELLLARDLLVRSEGQAQLALPIARDYLAARWLSAASAEAAAPALAELAFVEVGGRAIVPDHLGPTVAWAALEDSALLARVIEVEPLLLLRFGDQERIAKPERIAALDACMAQIDRYDIWRNMFERSALRRFAADLGAEVEARLARDDLSSDARELLLEFAAAGTLRGCLPHALAAARDTEADTYMRRRAFQAVRALADTQEQREFVAQLIHAEPEWDQDLAGELAQQFYPEPLDNELLAELLRRARPQSPTHSTALRTFLNYDFASASTDSELLPTLELLAELCPAVAGDISSSLRRIIRQLAARLLESLAPADEPPPALEGALAQLESGRSPRPSDSHEELSERIASRPRVQRWLFWHRVFAEVEKQGWRHNLHRYLEYDHGAPQPSAGAWLAEDARHHEQPEARALAFRTLLVLARAHTELSELAAELAAENPAFGEIALASLPPEKRWRNRAREVDAALRASLGDIDPFWLRWSAFMSELGAEAT